MAFKSAAGEFPEDFWKTYSAFANTQGGIIILGVSEKKGKFLLMDRWMESYLARKNCKRNRI
jgi:predicted HTH transcriptional regulator